VSKLCRGIDERVNAFLDRPRAGEWPYLWLDATYLRQREGGRIVSVAVIVAVTANAEGRREIVGLHIGPSEAETFWSTFLKSLVKRGLHGVKLVISDAHEGLKGAIARVLRATWQRCRVHTIRTQLRIGLDRAVAARLRQHFGSKTWQEMIPTPEWLAQVSQAFADAMGSECGCTLDFTTGSLTRLRDLRQFNRTAFFAWPEVQIGYGAYFGECLRRSRGAQWKLKPVPFGKSEPAPETDDNAVVRIILPFDGLRRVLRDSDEDSPSWWDNANSSQDQQILLVYPASFAANVQRDATDNDYVMARKALDKGEIESGLDLLAHVLQKRPRNQELASEIHRLCRVARLPQRARGLRAEGETDAEISVPPAPINAILTAVMRLEALLLRAFDEPFGSSLLCLARKPSPSG